MGSGGRQRIAFCRWLPRLGEQVLTMDVDGSDVVRLTGGRDQGENSCPAWSPDGTRICFASWRDGHTRLFVMDADGSRQTPVTPADEADEDFPAWSPDGAGIAFGRGDHGPVDGLYVLDLASGQERRLTDGSAVDHAPTWSPDGRWLAFRRSYGPRPGIYVIPTAGGDPSFLTPGSYPAWSPSADCIACSHNGCIWTIGVNGSGDRRWAPVAVRQDPEVMDRHPTWSPDARRLAFDRETYEDGAYVHHIMTVDVDGHALTTLQEGRLPAWSPDRPPSEGKERGAQMMRTVARLCVMLCLLGLVAALVGCGGSSPTGDSVAVKPVKPPPEPELDPVGDATGTIYYFDGTVGKVCTLDVASGGVTVLSQLSVTGSFDVSHSDPIFFLYDDGENVYRQSIAGEAPQLLTVPLNISALTPGRLSPDDTKVAFGAYVGTLVDNEVQGIYRVFEHTGIGTLGGTSWSPNGDQIAFTIRGSELGPDGYYHWDIAIANDAPWQNNTPPTLLTDTPADDEMAPGWGVDGDLAFSKTVRLRKGKLVGQDLYTIEPVAGATPSLAVSSTNTGQEFHFGPTWAPAVDSAGLWELGFWAGPEQGAPTMLMRSAADGSTLAAELAGPVDGIAMGSVVWRP